MASHFNAAVLKALLVTIDGIVDDITAVTAALPDAGALSDLATILTAVDTEIADILTDTETTIPGTISTLQSAVTAIKAITDVIPDAGALTTLKAAVDAIPTTMVGTNNAALAATLEDAMQKATNPAYNQDTDSLEALRELLDTIAGYIDTEIGAIITDTEDIQTTLGTPANFMADVSAITAAGPTLTQMNTAHGLLATPAQVATALTTYDAPTKGEMDTAHALLATPAQVATALGTYDAPTRAEATSDKDAVIAAIPAMVGTNSAMLAVNGALEATLTAIKGGGWSTQTLVALMTAIAAIPTTAMRGTDSATLQATWTNAMATALANYTAARAGYLDELAAANLPTDIANVKTVVDAIPTTAMRGTDNAATEAKQDIIDTNVDQIEVLVDSKVMGRVQTATTTESLNQVAGTYDLFTGTTQAVKLMSLSVKMPTGAAGGAITSISIQTDDATPGVIISSTTGAVANLTSEAELGWVGTLLINTGTKIQLTIAGGAHGSAYTVTVVAECRAVVSGGYLT